MRGFVRVSKEEEKARDGAGGLKVFAAQCLPALRQTYLPLIDMINQLPGSSLPFLFGCCNNDYTDAGFRQRNGFDFARSGSAQSIIGSFCDPKCGLSNRWRLFGWKDCS